MENKTPIGLVFSKNGDSITMWHTVFYSKDYGISINTGETTGGIDYVLAKLEMHIKSVNADTVAVYFTPENKDLIEEVLSGLNVHISVFDASGSNAFDLIKSETHRRFFDPLRDEKRENRWAACFALAAIPNELLPILQSPAPPTPTASAPMAPEPTSIGAITDKNYELSVWHRLWIIFVTAGLLHMNGVTSFIEMFGTGLVAMSSVDIIFDLFNIFKRK